MLLSFVVSCYNASLTITECLNSMILTSDTQYEIVIVDDGSTDNSLQLINSFKNDYPKISMQVISQRNQGSAAARNLGLNLAKGQFVFFCDSDDTVIVKEILELCLEMEDADCAIGNYTKYSRIQQRVFYKSQKDPDIPLRNQLENDFWRKKLVARKCWWTIIYRRDYLFSEQLKFLPTFEEAGGFFVLDDLYFLQQFYSGNPKILMSNRYLYRYTQDSEGHDREYLNQLKLQPRAAKIYLKHIKNFDRTNEARAASFMVDRLLGSYGLVSKELQIFEKVIWASAALSFHNSLKPYPAIKLPFRILKMIAKASG